MESQLQAACDLAVHSAAPLTYKHPFTLSGEAAVMVTAGTNPRGDGERGKKGGPRLLIWEITTKLLCAHLCHHVYISRLPFDVLAALSNYYLHPGDEETGSEGLPDLLEVKEASEG